MRDDFSKAVKQNLAERVAWLCSNPNCRVVTVGAHTDPAKRVSVGQACHIEAASEGGPRYNKAMNKAQRSSSDNGIWLCSIHAREIDVHPERFSVDLLREWKRTAEDYSQNEVGKSRDTSTQNVFTENVNRHREIFSSIRDIEYFHLHRNNTRSTLSGVGPLNIMVEDRKIDISFKENVCLNQPDRDSTYIGLICLPVNELIDYVVSSCDPDETVQYFNVTYTFAPNSSNEIYFSIRINTTNIDPYKYDCSYSSDYTVGCDELINDLNMRVSPSLEEIYLKIITIIYNMYRQVITFAK